MREVEELLDFARDSVDGISRQVILAYFACFKPESKRFRHLPQLQPVEEEGLFLDLLCKLPDCLGKKLIKMYDKAKKSFLNV